MLALVVFTLVLNHWDRQVQMNLDFFRNRKKFLIIIFFIIYSTISGQIVVPKDFMKIPDSLFYKEQLYKNIIPDKQYNYWKVVSLEADS